MDDLVIEIEDEVLRELARIAREEGCDVEELARQLITKAVVDRRG